MWQMGQRYDGEHDARCRGVDLVRAEFIPDSVDEIARSVIDLKRRVGPDGFVFTSGGIGPTHDDVTYEALAKAFGAPLQLHTPTVERMRVDYSRRGLELNEARLQMATLPTPSEVLFTPGLWVPLVNLQGVYILPGIPRLFQSMVLAHQERFTGPAAHFVALYTSLGEGDLAGPLAAVAKLHPSVAIGSYPNTAAEPAPGAQPLPFKVKLQLTGRDAAAVASAVEAVRAAVHPLIDAPAQG
ncbi:hypothetical protein FOA52_011585 [Chlamydomonas sp. UWO 241]|nr:hypothetical protein FOA52_011585 [Chlamydomonas sp. UWO 241]